MTRNYILYKIFKFSTIKRALKDFSANSFYVKAKRKKYTEYIRSCYNYSEKTPTVICSNCIGGMMFHSLGLKFMSPTINLWMSTPDFAKFVCNLDRYLNEELHFIKTDYDYPVGKIGDIKLFFQHYATEEESLNKWEERKKRIDRDNMFIITDDNALSDEAVKELRKVKCKRLVIFTLSENKGENFFCYKKYKAKQPAYSIRSFFGFAPFEREFNFAKWLSGEENFRVDKNF